LPSITSASFIPNAFSFTNSADVEQWAFSSATGFTYQYTATTTLASINGLSVNLCRYGAYTSGNVTIDVWYNGTTTPYNSVGSTTIAVASLPTGGDCWVNGKVATATQITLNKSFTATAGDSLYVKTSVDDVSATIAQSFYASASNLGSASFLGTNTYYLSGGKYLNAGYAWISGLSAYSTTWADLVQSARETNTCEGIFECAFAWAFYPSDTTLDDLRNINIASTTPFGYIYSIRTLFNTYGTTSTSTASISVNLASLVGSYATGSTTIPILSSSGMQTVLGTSTWNMLQTILTYMLWLGFMWYVYRRATSII